MYATAPPPTRRCDWQSDQEAADAGTAAASAAPTPAGGSQREGAAAAVTTPETAAGGAGTAAAAAVATAAERASQGTALVVLPLRRAADGNGATHGSPAPARVQLATFVDCATGKISPAVYSSYCADPLGRLRRAAARQLPGAVYPDELELRVWVTPRAWDSRGAAAVAAVWDAAAPVASLLTPPGPDPRCMWYILVRRRGCAVDATSAPAPAPQPVSVAMWTGAVKRTALLRGVPDPAADLRDGIADAACLCTGEGLDLRVVRGPLPPTTPGFGVGRAAAQDLWNLGEPLTARCLPGPGDSAVAHYVRRDGLPLGSRCGACSWCVHARRRAGSK
jgi:hypothetical protein